MSIDRYEAVIVGRGEGRERMGESSGAVCVRRHTRHITQELETLNTTGTTHNSVICFLGVMNVALVSYYDQPGGSDAQPVQRE